MVDSGNDAAWRRYIDVLSEVSDVSVESIHRDSLITKDLGLDSLAIVELAVVLIEELKAEDMEKALGSMDWGEVTVGALFDQYLAVR